MEKYVNGDTLIGEIVAKYPACVEILMDAGMHCLECAAASGESLEDACAMHGLPSPVIVNMLNESISLQENA